MILKPMLCETCLNGSKEIKKEEYGTTEYNTRRMTTLYYFCEKKGRYVLHREKYECADYANKRLTDFIEKEVIKKC